MTKLVKISNKLLRFGVLDFRILDLFVLEFVSDFDIRISDLLRWLRGA